MKLSAPSSLSPSAMSRVAAPGSSVSGKGGGIRSELAAIFRVKAEKALYITSNDIIPHRGHVLHEALEVGHLLCQLVRLVALRERNRVTARGGGGAGEEGGKHLEGGRKEGGEKKGKEERVSQGSFIEDWGVVWVGLHCYERPAGGAILTLSTSSSILLVSGTSGALGTVTTIGFRVLPSVPIEAVLTTWGGVLGSAGDSNVGWPAVGMVGTPKLLSGWAWACGWAERWGGRLLE
ncbi:hypothetical protein EYF80_036622 [Liparis tanakae]|uniref:Uncharacterized protein n=1 Tax=Liparis tanakae TaxID=230148 RepID=A0A4Z2GIY9_9TELE|nr:hypothetical protein EYF80_036622 [Liparis tanakae]